MQCEIEFDEMRTRNRDADYEPKHPAKLPRQFCEIVEITDSVERFELVQETDDSKFKRMPNTVVAYRRLLDYMAHESSLACEPEPYCIEPALSGRFSRTVTKTRKSTGGAATPVLENLVADCGLPSEYVPKIATALKKASQFIDSRGINHDVQHELFVDPEFPDWKMVKVTFRMDAALSHIYDYLKNPVYEIVSSELPDDAMENMIVKFDRL